MSKTKDISWESPLFDLTGKKSKTAQVLFETGHKTIKDILSIFPLRTEIMPLFRPFSHARSDQLFRGIGKVINVQEKLNNRIKGKGGIKLFNATCIVKDHFSSSTLHLKWFNLYPSALNKIKEYNAITFMGHVSEYLGQIQITNPDVDECPEKELHNDINFYNSVLSGQNLIRTSYPTVSGIAPHHIKKVFDKVPSHMWEGIDDPYPQKIIQNRNLFNLKKTYQCIHGKCHQEELTEENLLKAHERLLYNELINNQIKLLVRKEKKLSDSSVQIHVGDNFLKDNSSLFPYQLTDDQTQACHDIFSDFKNDYPMMRLIQGDVGCGKTSVALITALAVVEQGHQCAIMCPTETLALQHYQTFKNVLKNRCHIDYLTGSLKIKEKEERLEHLADGTISIIIGTHALIQKNVFFKNLAYVVIDEQHKFGVNQRIALVKKGNGTHCALMTATPIPRSLRLTQYGDLDMSLIRAMPGGRKGTQTRIVFQDTYEKYLSFLRTRIEMGEQAYVVVPAVLENEEQDILNLEFVLKKYKTYFPDFKIEGLHGQMKSDLKSTSINNFMTGTTQILVCTSVIEVGVNNPQATIMAILNPDRFGLSSLHQMRGRVGRGTKPGFCFLVNDKNISSTALERLKVIEKTTDGFLIADEDLRLRGEGNLFGKEQSGSSVGYLMVNIFERPEILQWADEDARLIHKDYSDLFKKYTEYFSADDKVTKTI